MALTLDIAANTRQAQAQVKDLGTSIEGVADSLDDLARDAQKAGDKTERALDDVGGAGTDASREIDRAGERIERTFRDMIQDARKAENAVDDVGNVGGKSLGKLGDKGAEVSGELRQNLGETFSSFRGDLEDLPQIAQDTLGGLAGSGALGGIPGLIATAVGAAGLGLLINAFDEAGQAQERLKEKTSEWADAFIESGQRVLTTEQIIAKGRKILNDGYEELQENARLWGVSEETALAAMTGSPAALDEVTAAVERKRIASELDAQQAQKTAEANGSALLALTPLEQEYAKAKGRLEEQTGAMAAAGQQADTYSYFLKDLAASTSGATTKVDEFGDSVVNLPDGTVIYIDAETGQATADVDAIEKKVYGLQDKDVWIRYRVDDREVEYYQPPNKVGTVYFRGGNVAQLL